MLIGSRRVFLLPALALAALATATPAFAQNASSDPGVGVGVLAGITRSSLHNDELKDFFKSKTGSLFGLWVGGNKNGLIGFTGEFNYLIRNVGVAGTDDTYKFHTLEIPALLRLNIGARSTNGATIYAVAGPVFSLNLKQELNGVDVGDNFNGGDVGIMAGAGFEVYRIGIEGRGNWGLRSVSDSGDVSDSHAFSLEFLAKFRFN
jgi:hypothetical protein